jgi:NADP-dependent 3-hydroxy acid dehydrogenase YdfG
MGDITQIKKRDFEQTVAVNLMGAFYCMRECIKQMKKQSKGGQIINVNSIAVKNPSLFPRRALHCATKAAIAALSASVQSELSIARTNIKIANIYSGPVLTEGFIKVLQEIKKDNSGKNEEFIKHILRPRDIAYVVWTIIKQGKNSNITEMVVQPSFYGRIVVARKL